MKVSIVIPVYNEEGNIIPLFNRIRGSMSGMDYDITAVDDGSSDNSSLELDSIIDNNLTVLKLDKHFGKCFALYEGIRKSSGRIIATLDSDMQNDPGDIPKMIEELGKGYDLVCGWRYDRRDSVSKRIMSRIWNSLNNGFLGMDLHDKVFHKGDG